MNNVVCLIRRYWLYFIINIIASVLMGLIVNAFQISYELTFLIDKGIEPPSSLFHLCILLFISFVTLMLINTMLNFIAKFKVKYIILIIISFIIPFLSYGILWLILRLY